MDDVVTVGTTAMVDSALVDAMVDTTVVGVAVVDTMPWMT